MRDSEMWLVLRDRFMDCDDVEVSALRLIRLSSVLSISNNDHDNKTYIGFSPDTDRPVKEYVLDSDNSEGIVYKGTFLQCFDYINKKENK